MNKYEKAILEWVKAPIDNKSPLEEIKDFFDGKCKITDGTKEYSFIVEAPKSEKECLEFIEKYIPDGYEIIYKQNNDIQDFSYVNVRNLKQ